VRVAASLYLLLLASLAGAQEVYRCTSPGGSVTYQQSPCPKASEERKVDATPANTDFDLSQREKLLKQGEEAGKRLEARAAAEEAERRRRAEIRARDEQREREALEREAAREAPVYIYARPPGLNPGPPYYPGPGPQPPRPQPRPTPSSGSK